MPVVWNAGWNHTICDIFHLTGAEGTTVRLKMCNHRITYNNFKKTSLRFCYKKKRGDKTHLQLGILVGAVKNRITCDIFHLI